MAVGAGHDVHEGEGGVVFVDRVGGKVAAQDLGEDVGGIVLRHLAGFPGVATARRRRRAAPPGQVVGAPLARLKGRAAASSSAAAPT